MVKTKASVIDIIGSAVFSVLFLMYISFIFIRGSFLMIPRLVEEIPLSTVTKVAQIHGGKDIDLENGRSIYVITAKIKLKVGDQVEKRRFSLNLMRNGQGVTPTEHALTLLTPFPYNALNIIFLAYLLLFQIYFYKKYGLPPFLSCSPDFNAIPLDYSKKHIRIPILVAVPAACVYYAIYATLVYIYLTP